MSVTLPQIPAALDLIGTAVFALTGAVLASRLRQTFVTMAFFALITGVGGGSVRDLLIGAPVFWVRDPWVAPVCMAVALLAWFTPHKWWEGRLLDWADAAGLAAYAVLGTAKALAFGIAPVPAVLMGVITGCVGGVIRDVLAGRPSIIMRPEIYVTAAALAAGLCAAGAWLGLPREIAWSAAMLGGFSLRGYAIATGLALPGYQRAGG
ncbi:MAG: TRIC cation channel family protein [Novosphingobium sp.]|uniref:trimeric intracellular cation channel family protein n=1 Tax=Novosphingobium sp. TaxID=1874826 RepID=UPI0032B929B3